LSLTPCTSRNWSVPAPGTCRNIHVVPPSVLRATIPPAALAHTTLSLTGLTAKNRKVVPVSCGVTVGELADCRDMLAKSGTGAMRSEHAKTAAAAARWVARIERVRERGMGISPGGRPGEVIPPVGGPQGEWVGGRLRLA